MEWNEIVSYLVRTQVHFDAFFFSQTYLCSMEIIIIKCLNETRRICFEPQKYKKRNIMRRDDADLLLLLLGDDAAINCCSSWPFCVQMPGYIHIFSFHSYSIKKREITELRRYCFTYEPIEPPIEARVRDRHYFFYLNF